MRIAFIGIGQSYPSHLWMRRMRQMLGDRIVVNIDDLRNTDRKAVLAEDTHYIPRKMSRAKRAMRAVRLISQTSEKLRSEWLLETIARSNASLVFVHFLNFATQFNDVWSRLGLPVVVHCHGYDVSWDVRHHTKQTLVHPPGYLDRVRSLPDNVWFIANSTHTRGQLLKLDINPDKIFLKRFGVPLSERPGSRPDREDCKLLYLGRLVECKGPLETARAFSLVANKHRGLTLDFAGDGPWAPKLDDLIDSLNLGANIQRHGVVSQACGKELRRRSTIFTAHNCKGAITGQEEAFGVSLLEAMGDGLPVITGRSGGIPDFIRHGENGLLFKPGDIEAHAGMLDDLLSSKRRRESLGQAAWETVCGNYQPHHELADMNRIFAQVSQIVSCPMLAAPTVSETNRRRAA